MSNFEPKDFSLEGKTVLTKKEWSDRELERRGDIAEKVFKIARIVAILSFLAFSVLMLFLIRTYGG